LFKGEAGMALYAFDGTWNEDKEADTTYENTNVVRFFNAYASNSGTDHNYYLAGVGTRLGALGHALGGAFGLGELPRLDQAYQHLCERWADGDRIIDIVGFSRGAATTLDFCNMILDRGIQLPDEDTVVEASPTVRFLGVWDVVAAFGLANLGMTDWNIGHHLSLPSANLQYAFHALALDERRLSFLPTRLEGACEVWFRGVHSDIGGGNGNRGLNDITLKWMMSKARSAGLPIAAEDIAGLQPDPTASPRPAMPLPLDIRYIDSLDRRHYTVAAAGEWRMPPATCPVETVKDEAKAVRLGAAVTVLSPAARKRVAALVGAAETAARELDFPLDGVRQALFTLIEGRIPLVTNDEQLGQARDSVGQLVSEMVRDATDRNFHSLNEFFLTEALFNLGALFPFTG
jgi:type VI secretion system (T6SS) phospholipase Tle1-like effector